MNLQQVGVAEQLETVKKRRTLRYLRAYCEPSDYSPMYGQCGPSIAEKLFAHSTMHFGFSCLRKM